MRSDRSGALTSETQPRGMAKGEVARVRKRAALQRAYFWGRNFCIFGGFQESLGEILEATIRRRLIERATFGACTSTSFGAVSDYTFGQRPGKAAISDEMTGEKDRRRYGTRRSSAVLRIVR